MNEHKVAWIVDGRAAVRGTQLKAAKKWGAVTIWLPEHGDVWEFVGSLRPNDVVGVWTCDLLAPPQKKRLGEKRSDVFRKVSEAIMEKGAKVYELSTERSCKDRRELVQMMLDARDVIAGNSGKKAGPGRPKKAPYTDEEKQLISDVWYKKTHKDNEERLAAVQRYVPRFTLADFYLMREELERL